MKLVFILLLTSILGSFNSNKNSLIGVWNLHVIVIGTDTIFYDENPEYTYQYNIKKNKANIKEKKDRLEVLLKAKENFNQTKSINIHFYENDVFSMTKIGGGGKMYPSERDSGSYKLKGDTIFMNQYGKSNQKMILIYDDVRSILYLKDNVTKHKTYLEYKKN